MADHKEVLGLFEYAWGRFRRRVEGLSDEEYLWEPAPNCWSIRRDADGILRRDNGLIFDEPQPLTTIAWRIDHLAEILASPRCAQLLGQEVEPSLPVAGTAKAALNVLEQAWGRWQGYVAAQDEASMRLRLGPLAEQYADEDRFAFIVHEMDEFIHHAAEVALLRDLYRATRPQDPFVVAALDADGETINAMRAADGAAIEEAKARHPGLLIRAAAMGRWDAVRLLVELGFPIEGTTGRGALHHAAADGRLDEVRMLLELGADRQARDPAYKETPLGWARYFRRGAVVDLLSAM
jgi:hypothetical protein